MKLFEYQAKEIFQEFKIDIPPGSLINNESEIADAIKITDLPCVLKSQVLCGGRGKAGLIQFSNNKTDAEEKAKTLFSSLHNVRKILVEKALDIAKELYISITMNPLTAKAMVIACDEGGIDIETVAATMPEKITREEIDLNLGLMDFQSKDLAYRLVTGGDTAKKLSSVIAALYQIFCKYDAELVEINPLFITKDGAVIAGDGKISIDDNSLFRQTRFQKTRDYFDNDIEYEASQEGIPYLQFDGNIGLMCAGAGLATTVFDLVNYAGGKVANYLEFGGPNYKKAVKAMELCLKNPSKVILIVTFGTIARADVMAEGVVEAINKLKSNRPIVTCIRGTNEETAVEILKAAGLECLFDTEEAVKKAVEIAARRI